MWFLAKQDGFAFPHFRSFMPQFPGQIGFAIFGGNKSRAEMLDSATCNHFPSCVFSKQKLSRKQRRNFAPSQFHIVKRPRMSRSKKKSRKETKLAYPKVFWSIFNLPLRMVNKIEGEKERVWLVTKSLYLLSLYAHSERFRNIMHDNMFGIQLKPGENHRGDWVPRPNIWPSIKNYSWPCNPFQYFFSFAKEGSEWNGQNSRAGCWAIDDKVSIGALNFKADSEALEYPKMLSGPQIWFR